MLDIRLNLLSYSNRFLVQFFILSYCSTETNEVSALALVDEYKSVNPPTEARYAIKENTIIKLLQIFTDIINSKNDYI